MKKLFTIIIIGLVAGWSLTQTTLAYVAESTSYKIESDSINFGGTENSTSASFNLSDTFGELATGNSSSATFNLQAGYRAMESEAGGAAVFITLSAPSDIALGEIDSGQTKTGSAVWNVSTNNSAGYRLAVKASTAPALKSDNDSFADYSPGGSTADFTWLVGIAESVFGFSPEGTDIVARFKDDGTSCATGSSDTSNRCWAGFSTTDQTIAQQASANNPAGTDTTLVVQASIGHADSLSGGDYTANITATAVTL